MDFSEALVAARKAAGFSQRAAVALLSQYGVPVSERSFVGYETGQHTPGEHKQRAILGVLQGYRDMNAVKDFPEETTPAEKPVPESNATLLDLGQEAIWIPYYPATLAAGRAGSDPLDIEPEGGFPLPSSFARRIGLTGNLFSAGVAGDSMREELHEGDVVFGIRQTEWDREAIYALYLDGGLLVKRIVKNRSRYELVSTNPAYPPRLVASDDAYIIGRVVGSINRL